ncbi:carboxylesterase 5A-like [Mercenaria mercenaria]|uniref:carboxylesterase 5A-like n=1 Tax=Mercenaria mercenaria TaxID=6596 RepID=UPI00234F4068|nr:carboxylesterase 5A-like [Mercenaria mercenaria]XP_045212411.2 carboxylesterase 5A-like [Mercenaria mercenaria]
MAYFTARIFILVSLVNRFLSAEIPSVTIRLGTISGETKSVIFRNKPYEVDRYLGIPYAKPPTGELRFRKPEPFGPFPEPYSATDFGPACPQAFILPHQPEEKTSEDCLFLNIYVPRQESDQRSGHAVMFFIHGGGFSMGSGTMYDGGVLSSVGNVIVVTINYRLGLLGFLDIDNAKSSGNFGFFDQRLALQWVNEHIGAFGGDKDRVTIFGESAGSLSVSLQMIYPPNDGLFRSGISQSAALTIPGYYQENNIEIAKYFAENMSCSVGDMDEVFSCLRSATPENIIKVVSDTLASGGMADKVKVQPGAVPTIDGEFIKTYPADLYRKAVNEESKEINFFRTLKLMNGVNGKEGAILLMVFGSDNLEDLEITREQMNTQQIPGATALVYGQRTVPEVVKQLLIAEYTDWENPDDPRKLREQIVRLFGDIYFNVPAIEMSRVHSNASDVDSYLYNFVAFLDKHMLPTPNWVGMANHGDELGPVFGYSFDLAALMNISDYTPPEWELELSGRMMAYWTNFAKTGDPNKPASDVVSSVAWPKYDVTSQSYIKFDREDSIGQYLFARETDFWKNTVSTVFDATEHAQTIASQCGSKDKQTCDKDGTYG